MHYNSARTGVRLIGPKPHWARSDGGEAGLHPSNIHDNAYAIGAVDFTGDMPVILGPDGPSLGGFVCPATIVQAELWKVGQLEPGDKVRFRALTAAAAQAAELAQDAAVESLRAGPTAGLASRRAAAPRTRGAPRAARAPGAPAVCYRRSGDDYLLVEYGPLALDLELRLRVHALHAVRCIRHRPAGRHRPHPGHPLAADPLRSARRCRSSGCSRPLLEAEARAARIDDIEVPTRIVHLPLSWDDPATQLAIAQIHADRCAPTRPGARATSSSSAASTAWTRSTTCGEIVFDASYLVLGLGDVYLGAPVATPVDPRHRLVTTKYNPARTWTPENAVGIGGAYLCVYGMEGPGGYQFVGRTCQMWNTLPRRPRNSRTASPGCCASSTRSASIRSATASSGASATNSSRARPGCRIEPETFRLRDYTPFLGPARRSIDAFKARQQAAFEAERGRWEASGQRQCRPPRPRRRRRRRSRDPAAGMHRDRRRRFRAASGRLHATAGATVGKGDAAC